MNNFQNIKKIKGDASFRKFFRRKTKKSTSIIVYAKKEKQKNLLIYDAINKVLNKNKICAPKLYKENYNNGYLEIEDFGNDTVHKIFKDKNKNKISHFIRIIKVLNQIQSIKNRSIKNFKNKKYTIPTYDNKILINEANLFTEWYVKKKLSKVKKIKFEKMFKKIIKKLTLNLKLKNNVFVHRDFHVSNLMLMDKKIGVIDSQDALIGNKAYDLASLIDDVRLKTSISLKDKIYNAYTKRQKKFWIGLSSCAIAFGRHYTIAERYRRRLASRL